MRIYVYVRKKTSVEKFSVEKWIFSSLKYCSADPGDIIRIDTECTKQNICQKEKDLKYFYFYYISKSIIIILYVNGNVGQLIIKIITKNLVNH